MVAIQTPVMTIVSPRTILLTALLTGSLTGAMVPRAGSQPIPSAAAAGAADTLPVPDTTLSSRPVERPTGIDSIVSYTAEDSVVYSLSTRTMYLYGKGDIRYRAFSIKADQIDINWNTSVLNAHGVPDTSDTMGKMMRGTPDLIDGGEKYKGSRVSYNFKSKRGKITHAETEIEKGFYYGEDIKKISSTELFVGDGRFTTCELEHPHFYFASPEMRVSVRDQVVARPVYVYISDVPVFALPFGIFPNERGRRSGLIAPAYGESERGRYLTHLGYYWAMSDYTDLAVRADGYTKGTWVLYGDFRYALRYNFNGTFSGSYANAVTGEPGDPDYQEDRLFNLRMTHNQEFDPTTRLIVDFTFTSGSYYQATSNSLNDLLRQNVVSNATLTKSWEGTPNSMTINLRRDQVIGGPNTGELREVLPGIGFNRAQSFPFRFGRKGTDTGALPWYELIGYTYGGQFISTRNKTLETDPTLKLTEPFRKTEQLGINHLLTVNASPRLGYVTVTPFFNYSEKWYNRSIRKEYVPADSTVETREVRGFQAVRSFDLGVAASTKLYGMFQPGILGIRGIRHQLVPSLSYTYQPDFSKPEYGYYGTYGSPTGAEIRYSFYEQEAFGGAPIGERQALGLRLGNILEMKTASSDTATQENKYQLINLDVSTGYNFARDSLKFDEIGVGFRTNIGQALGISGGSRFNLYKFEPDPAQPASGRRVDKFLWNEEGRLAQMTGFNISITTSLSGEKQQTKAGPIISTADSLRMAERRGVTSLYDDSPVDFSFPWNLDLSWNFSQDQTDPRVKQRSSNISASLKFNLTDNWRIEAGTSYDILNKVVAAPLVHVYRDLHCWEMEFNWVPTGQYRNFQLEIRLKAPMLRDAKVTKQKSARGIY
jgi:lipopolysaccharide assembly outer membrane protein LptD (OstA)